MSYEVSSDLSELLGCLASPFQRMDEEEAVQLARTYFGLDGTMTRLATEKDDTFKFSSTNGPCFVLKIANPTEDSSDIDLQVNLLQHVAVAAPSLPVPRVAPNLQGKPQFPYRDLAGQDRRVWMLSYLEGQPLSAVIATPHGRKEIGKMLARLRHALVDFSHPADTRFLAWDTKNLLSLAGLLQGIADPIRRTQCGAGIARFAAIEARLAKSRSQVLHNDFNSSNIVVDLSSPTFVSGIIDFGDAVRTSIAVDVSTAMMNQLPWEPADKDMFADGCDVLSGYLTIADLNEEELSLIPHLIMSRVVARALLSTSMAKLIPERAPYLLRNTEQGWRQLEWLLERSQAELSDRLVAYMT